MPTLHVEDVEPDEDDLVFARETLGDRYSYAAVYELAAKRARIRAAEQEEPTDA